MKQKLDFYRDKLPRILEAVTDHFLKVIPETGLFQPYTISFDVPDLYVKKGALIFETDRRSARTLRRVSVAVMFPDDSGRRMSHYLYSGTNREVADWLLAPERSGELKHELEELSRAVHAHD